MIEKIFNVLAVIGFIIFLIGGCSLDSPSLLGFKISVGLTAVGMLLCVPRGIMGWLDE